MSTFLLKVIASVCMVIDHIGAIFPAPATPSVFRMVGRIAYPVFAFLIAEGCIKTKNMSKYSIRLGVFALISQMPFDIAFNSNAGSSLNIDFFNDTNVFYTLFLGVSCIYVYEGLKNKSNIWAAFWPLLLVPSSILAVFFFPEVSFRVPLLVGFGMYLALEIYLSRDAPIVRERTKAASVNGLIALILTVPIFMLGGLLQTDYGMYGVLYIILFYLAKPGNRLTRSAAMFCVVFIEYGYPYVYTKCENIGIELFTLPGEMMFFTDKLDRFWFALGAVPLVFLYNGKSGPKAKWFFYWLYPVHLMVLSAVRFLMEKY